MELPTFSTGQSLDPHFPPPLPPPSPPFKCRPQRDVSASWEEEGERKGEGGIKGREEEKQALRKKSPFDIQLETQHEKHAFLFLSFFFHLAVFLKACADRGFFSYLNEV